MSYLNNDDLRGFWKKNIDLNVVESRTFSLIQILKNCIYFFKFYLLYQCIYICDVIWSIYKFK